MPAPQPEPLRLLIVANKAFECEPLVSAMLARDARPLTLSNFARGYDPAEVVKPARKPEDGSKPEKPPQPPKEADGLPLRGNLPIRPRLALAVAPNAIAEVWCIEDWMRKQRKKTTPKGEVLVDLSSSSSFEKFNFTLPQIKKRAFGGNDPNLVIGFGTAGIPAPESMNGCVAVGTRVYIHDPWAKATKEDRATQEAQFGPLLDSPVKEVLEPIDSPQLPGTLFPVDMSVDVRYAAEARFLRPPVEPAALPRILAGHGFASLGTINVCNYDDYVWADEETLQRFDKQIRQREIGSIETTHGLIRLTWKDTAFVFVSGLTDRVPLFNAEVGPRVYAQNFAAAHNAGVTAGFLLAEFARLHSVNKLFA